MDGLVAGLYEIVPALQKVAAALTILALVVLGIGIITGGAEGRSKFKEVMKNIVIGCALVFGASSLGNMLMETAWQEAGLRPCLLSPLPSGTRCPKVGSLKNCGGVSMKKKEKKAVIRTCLDILPVRSWEPSVGAFLLADGSYLDLLRLIPRDLQNIAEDELELEIYQFTKVLKTVGCDLKFLSMRFPLSLERQKAVLLHHARQAGDETRIRWLERQIRELEVAETNISSQHFYLAYWGKDADTLRKNHDMIRKYAATGYQPLVEEIDARQKAKVLEKLANMNTIIDIYPDGDDDSAPGFMEEEG